MPRPNPVELSQAQLAQTNDNGSQSPERDLEKLYTIKAAAAFFNAYDWALHRAIRRGLIPYYTPFNNRKFVRLSEVAAAINASKVGGVS